MFLNWPRVELVSEVPKERRGAICVVCSGSCMRAVWSAFFLQGRKEKQQLDTNVCVQTDE